MKTAQTEMMLTNMTTKKMAPEAFPTELTGRTSREAGVCLRLAGALRRSLRGLDWEGMNPADRDGLRRVLTDLGADIPLVWLIGGQRSLREDAADTGDTAKAAPAASPSRWGIESSDGEAAVPGHPAPAGEP